MTNEFALRFSSWFFQFVSPQSRIFIPHLMVCGIFLLFWIGRNRSKVPTEVFTRGYWLNFSTLHDLCLYTLNSALKASIFIPLFATSFFWIKGTTSLLALSEVPQQSVHSGAALAAFTLVAFVWDDLLRFSHHLTMHKVGFLWKIHQTHHSATSLTPLTLYRFHPIEVAISTLRNALSIGVTTGLLLHFFSTGSELTTILGVNSFTFAFNTALANLRHSPFPIRFGVFEWIFISPYMHQLHHSTDKEHFDKNFGVSLSVWDYILGSYLSPKESQQLKYGV